jgi:hypothetical protein
MKLLLFPATALSCLLGACSRYPAESSVLLVNDAPPAGPAPAVATASVSGAVLFDGDPPPAAWIQIPASDRARAGVAQVRDESWIVSADGGVANCVVTLFPRGDTPTPKPVLVEGAEIAHVGARYEPHVLAVPEGTTVALCNADSDCAVFHLYAKKNPGLNAKIAKGEARELVFARGEDIRISSDCLPWMSAFLAVVDTPLYAVTGADGAFRIDDLAPGRYRLEVWHEEARR